MNGRAETHLVVERDGQLWAVPGQAVDHLERGAGRLKVRLGSGGESADGGQLTADRLLAVAAGLEVRPTPGAVGRYWPEAAVGLALWARRPVVVIDPAHPPRVLVSNPGEDGDG
ncbi:MAG TPA: hypothetical protein VM617_00440 [Thermoanaerobaculia bacterium]|nr:hypothetical protein [Thermoanaerobaculia bacterium]